MVWITSFRRIGLPSLQRRSGLKVIVHPEKVICRFNLRLQAAIRFPHSDGPKRGSRNRVDPVKTEVPEASSLRVDD